MKYRFIFEKTEDILAAARSCGFSLDFLHVSPNQDTFTHEADLLNLYRSLPFIPFIPEEMRDAFYKEAIDDFIRDNPPDEHGLIHQSAPVITLIVKKPF